MTQKYFDYELKTMWDNLLKFEVLEWFKEWICQIYQEIKNFFLDMNDFEAC